MTAVTSMAILPVVSPSPTSLLSTSLEAELFHPVDTMLLSSAEAAAALTGPGVM